MISIKIPQANASLRWHRPHIVEAAEINASSAAQLFEKQYKVWAKRMGVIRLNTPGGSLHRHSSG